MRVTQSRKVAGQMQNSGAETHYLQSSESRRAGEESVQADAVVAVTPDTLQLLKTLICGRFKIKRLT